MKNRAFTLIEVLIYIALFSILMSGAIVASFNLLEGGSRNETAIGIQEEGTFINRKINWALTGASAVTTTGTTLTITRPDLGPPGDPLDLVITGNGTMVTLSRGAGGLAVQLNSERYAIANPASGPMFLVQPATAGRPPSVTISFQIQGRPFIFRTYARQ